MPYKKILIAYNGQPEEKKVLAEALGLQTALKAQLSILHVNHPDAGTIHMMMNTLPKVTRSDLIASIKEAGFENEFSDTEVLILTEPSLSEAIGKATTGFDLLIMGHHKQGLFQAVLTDSTDEKVANKTTCPQLLVPLQ